MGSNNHLHKEECEACANGMDAVLEKERKSMETMGWYAHYVPDAHDCPFGKNYHTHGLPESFNHPDLQICLGMRPETAHMIISNAVEEIKKGKKYEHGKRYDDLIVATDPNLKYDVLVLEAEECERPVLRLIMPDKAGTFDGELAAQMEGCKEM